MTAAYQTAVLGLNPTSYWPLQDEAPGPRDIIPGVGACSKTFVDIAGSSNLTRSTANNGISGTPVSRWLIDGPMGGDVGVAAPQTPNDWILGLPATCADTFSMAIWARFSMLGALLNSSLALFGGGTNTAELYMAYSGGVSKLTLAKTGVANIVQQTGAGFSNLNTDLGWHFFAATKAGATSKLYIDGADVTGVVTDQTCVAGPMALASGFGGTSALTWWGAIAHAALWVGTAIALADVQTMFNAAAPFRREEIKAAGGARSENIVPVGSRRAVVKPN